MSKDPATRVFTVEEVDALVPTLTRLVGAQLERQSNIERMLEALMAETGELPHSLSGGSSDTDEVRTLKTDLRDQISQYNQGWEEVQSLGAVVKDPKVGLVDFYGRIDGRLVWLCWRYGESRLGFYHDLDSGFSGRREIGPATRDRLLN